MMKIAIDNQLIDYLADAGEIPNCLLDRIKRFFKLEKIFLDRNPFNKDIENRKSLVNIIFNHNCNNIDLFIPYTVKSEIYAGKLIGHIKQLRKIFMAAMLKGIEEFISKLDFDNGYARFKDEFGKYFNFEKQNQEKDFRILVECILFDINILITYDHPLINKCKNKEIVKYIKVLLPADAEKYLIKNYTKYKKYG